MLHIRYGHLCHGDPYLVGRIVHVTENNELSLLMLHILLIWSFMGYCSLHCHVKMKRARERGKTQTMEGTIITEREVRNQRAMINDTILVGTCSEHH